MDSSPRAKDAPVIAMVAGEASGDLLAGLLLAGVRQRWQGAIAHGIGGRRWPSRASKLGGHTTSWQCMASAGSCCDVTVKSSVSALHCGDRLLAHKPDVFIGVDAPDFNLDLEARLKAQGVKTVHFVCPSIWAWRPERVEKLRRSTDHVLCIFPFEPELLASHGVAATYVGHPLANVIPMEPDKAAARRVLGLSDADEVVAILPGSRQSEIRHLASRFFRAAALIQSARPAIRFIAASSSRFAA